MAYHNLFSPLLKLTLAELSNYLGRRYNMDEFNRIANDIENEHTWNGIETNDDGGVIVVHTPWACGFTEGDDMG